MTNPKWKPTTINLTPEEYRCLRLVSGVQGQSVSAFIRHLIEIYLDTNKSILPIIEEILKNKKEDL